MRLSIIIIEYYCMDQVVDCVESINRYIQGIDKECLVISNSEYSESELDSLQKDLAGARIIDSQGNLGYAGGVNTGLKQASGEYIYVVNPDCLLIDSNIGLIMDAMDAEADWAISGPKVVDENNVIQASCRRFPRLWTFLLVRSVLSMLPGADKERARYLMEDFDHLIKKEVDWVSGGATLVKQAAISHIGGMDERYFLYMEDVDWCRTCWEQGFKVKYMPVSVVMHAGQHQSIQGGLIDKLMSRHVRMHLTSMVKYFLKYMGRGLRR